MLEQQLRDQFLTEFRAARITQAELARRTDLTPKHINQIIRGHAALTLTTADTLITALGREWVIGTRLPTREPSEPGLPMTVAAGWCRHPEHTTTTGSDPLKDDPLKEL